MLTDIKPSLISQALADRQFQDWQVSSAQTLKRFEEDQRLNLDLKEGLGLTPTEKKLIAYLKDENNYGYLHSKPDIAKKVYEGDQCPCFRSERVNPHLCRIRAKLLYPQVIWSSGCTRKSMISVVGMGIDSYQLCSQSTILLYRLWLEMGHVIDKAELGSLLFGRLEKYEYPLVKTAVCRMRARIPKTSPVKVEAVRNAGYILSEI